MGQIISDNSYLLKLTTFLEDLSYAFDLFKDRLFINRSICSHPSLEVVYLLLCLMAVIHSLKCTVSFSFVVPLAVICCPSLSFVVTRCHSLSRVFILCHSLYYSLLFIISLVVIRCHSLSFAVIAVPLVITRLSFYERSLFEIILQE